jgi:hypothetical protein
MSPESELRHYGMCKMVGRPLGGHGVKYRMRHGIQRIDDTHQNEAEICAVDLSTPKLCKDKGTLTVGL